ncbi:MAG: mechanosensitive ion channel family protein [Rhodocyclaceae bacterium]|nr:mechanosensitive ion channel family protein [Rhodocyclaceae bacterium]
MPFDTLPAEQQVIVRVVLSLLLISGLALLRRAAIRRVRGDTDALDPRRRRQIFYIGNAFNLATGLGLLLLWLGQVQNLLLSLTAVTVAVVLATKELLMCVSGFALRTGANSFSVGDYIEVGSLRGEVTDFNLLSTTLLEVADAAGGYAHTGHRIVLPNSLFLTNPVRNGRQIRPFVLHEVAITADPVADPAGTLAWLESRCQTALAPFAELAQAHGSEIDRKFGIDLPGPDAEVSLRTTDGGKLVFSMRLFCPASRARFVEQEITAALLQHLASVGSPPAAPKP